MFRLCCFPAPGSGKATECQGDTEGQKNSVQKWLHRKVQSKAQSCYCREHKISVVEASVLSIPSSPDSCEGLMMAYLSSVL